MLSTITDCVCGNDKAIDCRTVNAKFAVGNYIVYSTYFS